MKNYGAYGALHPLDLQYPVLEDVAEFLYVLGRNKRDDVKLAGYFVEFLDVGDLLKSLNDLVHVGRLDKDVDKSEEASQDDSRMRKPPPFFTIYTLLTTAGQ